MFGRAMRTSWDFIKPNSNKPRCRDYGSRLLGNRHILIIGVAADIFIVHLKTAKNKLIFDSYYAGHSIRVMNSLLNVVGISLTSSPEDQILMLI